MKCFLPALFLAAFLAAPAFAEDPASVPAAPAAAAAPVAPPAADSPDSAEMKIIKGHVPKPVDAPATVPGDPPEVTALKTKASAGDVAAQHELGVLYADGQGDVERNYDEALKWHRMAADNGNAESQQYMGYSYESGIGVTRSDVDAAAWYMKAANQGNAAAQGIIGNMYATGRGLDESFDQAFVWLSLAKKGGDTFFENTLEDVSNKVNKKHIKSINRRIRDWKPVIQSPPGEKTDLGD